MQVGGAIYCYCRYSISYILYLVLYRFQVINTTKETKLDKRSVIYSTLGFGLMLYAFSSAGNLGFLTQLFFCSVLISLIIIGIFVEATNYNFNPLLNLKIFNNKIFFFYNYYDHYVIYGRTCFTYSIVCSKCFRIICVAIRISNYAWRDYQWYYAVFTGKFYDKYGPRQINIYWVYLIVLVHFYCMLS